jgi:hypothetical protein
MRHRMGSRGLQRGQAMAEFAIGIAAMVPLFLALSYAARYSDLQQQATQASRYAAFQRAQQPDGGRLSNAKIEDQMRARFFLAPLHRNDGRLQDDDSVARVRDATGQPGLWRDLGGSPLLVSPEKVTLRWEGTALGSAAVARGMGVMNTVVGKDWRGGQRALVELELTNKLDLVSARPEPLRIGAATAAVGDAINSSGSADTAATAGRMVPIRWLPNVALGVIEGFIWLFEDSDLELGCIKPDVVANHRLEGAAGRHGCR